MRNGGGGDARLPRDIDDRRQASASPFDLSLRKTGMAKSFAQTFSS
jgi:hypothetical protein